MRRIVIGLAALAADVVATVLAFPSLPSRVPIHWDVNGNANGYGSPLTVVLVGPRLVAGILALTTVLARIDPKQAPDALARSTREVIESGVVVLVATLHMVTLAAATGIVKDPTQGIAAALGERRDQVTLSTKGGYGVAGVDDWTDETIRLGVDRALRVLRVAHVDVFHLHSCPLATLQREDILRALVDARAAGKIRVAAYSGEGDALAWAIQSGHFGSVQCSVNLFDQANLGGVREAEARGIGVIAKRPLANAAFRFTARPPIGSYAKTYWERMTAMALAPADGAWAETALRFSAFSPGVSAVIVGSNDAAHLTRNVRAIRMGPLPADERARWQAAFAANDRGWRGEI